jgi:hypothetical protein
MEGAGGGGIRDSGFGIQGAGGRGQEAGAGSRGRKQGRGRGRELGFQEAPLFLRSRTVQRHGSRIYSPEGDPSVRSRRAHAVSAGGSPVCRSQPRGWMAEPVTGKRARAHASPAPVLLRRTGSGVTTGGGRCLLNFRSPARSGFQAAGAPRLRTAERSRRVMAERGRIRTSQVAR